MARQENTFEGGTNGTAVTAVNSGGASGDAFYFIAASGVSPQFSNAHPALGGMGMYIAAADKPQIRYAVSGPSIAMRWHLYTSAVFASDCWLARGVSSSANQFTLLGKDDGKLHLTNTSGATVWDGSYVFPALSQMRLELLFNAAAGTISGKLCNIGETTVLDSFSLTGQSLSTATTFAEWRKNQGVDGWLDNLAVEERDTFIGEVPAPVVPPTVVNVSAPMRATGANPGTGWE